MTPTLKLASWKASPVEDAQDLPGQWKDWVVKQAEQLGDAWLLAFSLEGAAWGRIQAKSLSLAPSSLPAQVRNLDDSTLQELFVFSESGQVHAWIVDGQWKAVLIQDSATSQDGWFDQEILLWGTHCPKGGWKDGFALLEEGLQGMRQAVPLDHQPVISANRKDTPRLKVRVYLGQSPQNGAAVVAATRLVALIG